MDKIIQGHCACWAKKKTCVMKLSVSRFEEQVKIRFILINMYGTFIVLGSLHALLHFIFPLTPSDRFYNLCLTDWETDCIIYIEY